IDLWSFTAVDGERVNIEALTTATTSGAFGVCWGLYDKEGQPVAGCGACNGGDQCGPLSAAASPYSVVVADLNSDGTGTYQITLERLTATTACGVRALGCDTPSDATLTAPTDIDLWSFTAVDGERVNIEELTTATTSGAFGVCWGLYDKDGQPVAGCGACNGGDQCGPLSAAA